MIARTWQGATREVDAERYTAYMEQTGLEQFRVTPGNLGAQILRRIAAGKAEFVVISYWESEEAIRRFAGDDLERARFFPEDDRYLVDRDERTRHFEVAARFGAVGA